MTENAAVVVGVDGSEGSRAALRWAAQEAHRRQLPLRIVVAAGLDAVMPATASESFWRHLSAHQSRGRMTSLVTRPISPGRLRRWSLRPPSA
jgi:nucleotide-binding universal stress UspA family protein